MKLERHKAGIVVVIVSIIFGCQQLIPPEISDEPVQYSMIRTNKGIGFIDQSGKVTIEPQFSDVKPFSDGLAAVKVPAENGESSWGFINHKGEFVIKPKYRRVDSFSEKLAFVWEGMNFHPTVIDQHGNEVIKNPEKWLFGPVAGFSNGLSTVSIAGKIGFMNTKGEIVIEPKFDHAREFSNGLAFVEVGKGFEKRVGYIDQSGKLAIPLNYEDGTDFSEERALVRDSNAIDSYYSIIDKTGKIIREKVRLNCSGSLGVFLVFSEQLLPTRLDLANQKGLFIWDGCGYINVQGDIVIPPDKKIQGAEPFFDGLAAVEIKTNQDPMARKWGFIDKTGKIVIEPIFEEASNFKNGLAYVKVDVTKEGYINRAGQFVWQPYTF